MLQPSSLGINCDIDTANDLFEQLSVSLDSRFLRHKHIAANPKLKRLFKLKSGFSVNGISTTAVCSRCKKEAFVVGKDGDGDKQHDVAEKEVEVKKDLSGKSGEKKVHFLKGELDTKGEIQEKADNAKKVEICTVTTAKGGEKLHESDEISDKTASSTFPEYDQEKGFAQPVFFARRPSIIGNNEFWLPKYSSSEPIEEGNILKTPITTEEHQNENVVKKAGNSALCETTSTLGQSDPSLNDLEVFLGNIFKNSSKGQVKILQVCPMLDDTYVALTEEHFFKCKIVGSTYEIVEAISLKDVQKIMVSETCAVLVLEVCHASSLKEFKEFVPGYSEKTESLISLMVYALSRIKNFLLDVIRLPLMDLPTCEAMHCWLVEQNEEIMYTGIGTVENISHPECEDLAGEGFMMKIGDKNRFHPVFLLLRAGYLTSKCNGGCAIRSCKYSVTLKLQKDKIFGMRREDKPWPNCVRLITDSTDITFAGSDKASADELLEKMYSCIQPIDKKCMKLKVFVLVTVHSLQLFTMTLDKIPVFGSPLLNLEFFDENAGGTACIIDSQGVEAEADNMNESKTRWHLTFLAENEKQRFLTATSVE